MLTDKEDDAPSSAYLGLKRRIKLIMSSTFIWMSPTIILLLFEESVAFFTSSIIRKRCDARNVCVFFLLCILLHTRCGRPRKKAHTHGEIRRKKNHLSSDVQRSTFHIVQSYITHGPRKVFWFNLSGHSAFLFSFSLYTSNWERERASRITTTTTTEKRKIYWEESVWKKTNWNMCVCVNDETL